MAVPLSAPRTSEALYLKQAIAQLREWPALTWSQIPGGFAFTIDDTEILRLTGHSTARLHLTGPVIDRLHHALCTSTQINFGTDHGWLTMQIEASPDLDLLLALVSVAIKANT